MRKQNSPWSAQKYVTMQAANKGNGRLDVSSPRLPAQKN